MTHKITGDQSDHDRGIRSEERLCSIDTKWIAHDEVHDLEAQALALQHREYERRLLDLNHEAQRIAADKLTFASGERVDAVDAKIDELGGKLSLMLPRETFDTFLRDPYQTDGERRDARLKVLEDWKNKATGAAVILTLVSAAIGAAIVKAFG